MDELVFKMLPRLHTRHSRRLAQVPVGCELLLADVRVYQCHSGLWLACAGHAA